MTTPEETPTALPVVKLGMAHPHSGGVFAALIVDGQTQGHVVGPAGAVAALRAVLDSIKE